ncbi:MAG: hypothetical protein Wins2KO_23450 [Winogradskyella sp.]
MIGGFSQVATDWSIPNMGSTDIFNTCNKNEQTGIKNYNGYQKPKSGSSYAGMYLYTDKNYREYVQGELNKTLIKGKAYTMTFYLSLAEGSSYALKDIEVLFTEEKLKPCYHSNNCEKVIKPSKSTKKTYKMYSNTEENYFSSKDTWMEYSFEFIAEGYENFFSIGNFFNNSKTKKQKTLSTYPYLFSYYYIDDVSVSTTESLKETEVILLREEEKPEPLIVDEVYTFTNVLFEFNKAELQNISIDELDKLTSFLKMNINLNIEIYGHTDNVGSEKRNKELSQLRAKAVADYLISQGIDASRINYFGFGSTQPISENDTEKSRKRNRRVEFKLIE